MNYVCMGSRMLPIRQCVCLLFKFVSAVMCSCCHSITAMLVQRCERAGVKSLPMGLPAEPVMQAGMPPRALVERGGL